MKLYYHHVGAVGATEDFPKTVFKRVPISLVEQTLKNDSFIKPIVLRQLRENFPGGTFNCWGVPEPAHIVIKNLRVGDTVLLVESVAINGEVPALGKVKVFEAEQMRDLSFALWGKQTYPYIFFFDTCELSLLWIELLDLFGYKDNFDPRGKFYSVSDERLRSFGGAEPFVKSIQAKFGKKGC